MKLFQTALFLLTFLSSMENVVGLIIADSPTNGGGNNVVEDQVRRLQYGYNGDKDGKSSKGSTPKTAKSAKSHSAKSGDSRRLKGSKGSTPKTTKSAKSVSPKSSRS